MSCHSTTLELLESLELVEESLMLVCGYARERIQCTLLLQLASMTSRGCSIGATVLNNAPLSSVQEDDDSRVLAPWTTMGGPRLFLLESTKHMCEHVQCMCWSS
jgi:hypothetical protein